MLAITVAVRIDLYGIFYCAVLGVLLLLPRRVMALVWLLYTPLHGLLLILQYSMLLGVPQGVCFYPGGSRGTLCVHVVCRFILAPECTRTGYFEGVVSLPRACELNYYD